MSYKTKQQTAYDLWSKWLEQVSVKARRLVAKTVRKADLSTPAGLTLLSQELMAQVIEGRLSPEVSADLREWARLVHDQLVSSKVTETSNATFVGSVNTFMQAAINQTPQQPALAQNVLDADPLTELQALQLKELA